MKTGLHRRTGRHERNMGVEVREILHDATKDDSNAPSLLGSRLAARFAGSGLAKETSEMRGQKARPASFEQ